MIGGWLRDARHSLRTAPAFSVALLLTLAVAAFSGLLVSLMALRLETLLPGPFAQMAHFTEPHHRTHDLTFAFLFVPTVVGALALLRRPSEHIAGMLMTLVPSAALLLTLLLTLARSGDARVLQPPWVLVMAAALTATVLHPSGRGFFRSFALARVGWSPLVLVIVAAPPLVMFVVTNVARQATLADGHAAAGHYGFMAAFGLTVLGVGLLASLRPDGWRVAAVVAGLLPALLGGASLLYPDATSSLDIGWALTALAWALAFVTVMWMSHPARPTRNPVRRQSA